MRELPLSAREEARHRQVSSEECWRWSFY